MTAASPPHATVARYGGGPPDGVLLRMAVENQDWTSVPPAPAGADITVSFSCVAAAASAPRLAALGYRCVGLSSVSASPRPVVDFLVPQALVDQHPQWWRAMAGHAERIFALGFGPVEVALREILRAHRKPVR